MNRLTLKTTLAALLLSVALSQTARADNSKNGDQPNMGCSTSHQCTDVTAQGGRAGLPLVTGDGNTTVPASKAKGGKVEKKGLSAGKITWIVVGSVVGAAATGTAIYFGVTRPEAPDYVQKR